MLVSRDLVAMCRIYSLNFSVARGFTRSGQGNPDEARAARYILKDYVNAKLLFCHPPPEVPEDSFNAQTREYALQRAAGKKKAPVTRVVKGADTFIPLSSPHPSGQDTPSDGASATVSGRKTTRVDQEFFANNAAISSRPFTQGSKSHGQEFSRSRLYPHQNSVADDGTPLSGRRARIAAVLANAGSDVGTDKKHHKKMKRVKQRSGKGYD